MTIRHINIFLAVCEAGQNTTKAAEQLHMSQPAVSLAIRELEEYYGGCASPRPANASGSMPATSPPCSTIWKRP